MVDLLFCCLVDYLFDQLVGFVSHCIKVICESYFLHVHASRLVSSVGIAADALASHVYHRQQMPYARAALDKQSCVITPTFVYHD